MGTQNMSEAGAGRTCPVENEQCLQVTGPRNEGSTAWARPPLLSAPEVGIRTAGRPTEHVCSLPSPSVGEGGRENSGMVVRQHGAADAPAHSTQGLGHPALMEAGAGQDAGAEVAPGAQTLHLQGVGSGEGAGPGPNVAGPQMVPPGTPSGLRHPVSLALACQPNPGPDPGPL